MKKQIKYLTFTISIFFIFFFLLFVINQTASVVELANNFNPFAGKLVLYSLILVFIILLAIPIIIIFRMPPAIRLPESEDTREFEVFLAKMRTRLRKNSNLSDEALSLESKADIEEAVKVLDTKANELIKSSSHTVFLTTAISQNGKLDAFVVLAAQTRP
ncbi:MAG: hypothetical protein GY863_00650, partial [bacterium]|nr:hypothetical protein [bacterium]